MEETGALPQCTFPPACLSSGTYGWRTHAAGLFLHVPCIPGPWPPYSALPVWLFQNLYQTQEEKWAVLITRPRTISKSMLKGEDLPYVDSLDSVINFQGDPRVREMIFAMKDIWTCYSPGLLTVELPRMLPEVQVPGPHSLFTESEATGTVAMDLSVISAASDS
ncbi:uncharacterized protein LOC144255370 isoform X2 [Urocitellus parryii]